MKKNITTKQINNIKEILALLVIIAVLAVIFFSYNLNLTWDSTEYIGLASFIGNENMKEDWIAHRGIGFPWLIKLSQSFGKTKIAGLLNLMFVFYCIMICSMYLIYKKLKNLGILKNKLYSLAFIGFVGIFIALNPMIFGYYHTALTEFVGITSVAFICALGWCWMDYEWSKNKVRNDYCSCYIFINNNVALSCKAITSSAFTYSNFSNCISINH